MISSTKYKFTFFKNTTYIDSCSNRILFKITKYRYSVLLNTHLQFRSYGSRHSKSMNNESDDSFFSFVWDSKYKARRKAEGTFKEDSENATFDIWFKRHLKSVKQNDNAYDRNNRISLSDKSLVDDAHVGIGRYSHPFVDKTNKHNVLDYTEKLMSRSLTFSYDDTKHYYYYDDSVFSHRRKIYPSFDSFESDFDYTRFKEDPTSYSLWKQTSLWNRLNFVEPDRYFSDVGICEYDNVFEIPDLYDLSVTTGTEFFIIFFEYYRRKIFYFFDFSYFSGIIFWLHILLFFVVFLIMLLLLFGYPKMHEYMVKTNNDDPDFPLAYKFHNPSEDNKTNCEYFAWWQLTFFFFFDLFLCSWLFLSVLLFSTNPFILEIYKSTLSFTFFSLFWFVFIFFFIISIFVQFFYYNFIKSYCFDYIYFVIMEYTGLDFTGNFYFFDKKRTEYDYIWLGCISFLFHIFFFLTVTTVMYYVYICYLSAIVISSGSNLSPFFPFVKLYRLFIDVSRHAFIEQSAFWESKKSRSVYPFFLKWRALKKKDSFRRKHSDSFREKPRMSMNNSKAHFFSRFWLTNFLYRKNSKNLKDNFMSNDYKSTFITSSNVTASDVLRVHGVRRVSDTTYSELFRASDSFIEADSFMLQKKKILFKRHMFNHWFFNTPVGSLFRRSGLGFSGGIVDNFFFFITAPFSFYRSSLETVGNINSSMRQYAHCYRTLPLQFIMFTKYLRSTHLFDTELVPVFSVNSSIDLLSNYSSWNTTYNIFMIRKFLLSHQVLFLYNKSFAELLRSNTIFYINNKTKHRRKFWAGHPLFRLPVLRYHEERRVHYLKFLKIRSSLSVKKCYVDSHPFSVYNSWSSEFDRLYDTYFFFVFNLVFDSYNGVVLPVFDHRTNRFISEKAIFDDVVDLFNSDDEQAKQLLISLINKRKYWYRK